mmetsp:Transcript_108056/g.293010  ORF Transcript_108056/g.293010 Transcript_108056/m.293010 type:complete len:512 (+) Transcript_108056:154-1689(+)
MQRPRADGRPAAFGRRPAAWACGLLGLSALCAPAAATRIIGSDGKEYQYHGLRHRGGAPGHARHASGHHETRMLNAPPREQVHANLTVREIPEGIAESHLSIQHKPSSHVVSGFGAGRNGHMKMMRADWCSDVSKAITALERQRCQGFMRTFCHPTHGDQEPAGVAAQSLCAKFYAAPGLAGHVEAGHVAFHLGGAGTAGTPPVFQLTGSPLAPAPVAHLPASPSPSKDEGEQQPMSPAPAAEAETEAAPPAPAEEAEAGEIAVKKHRLDRDEFVIKSFAPGPAPAPGPGPAKAQFGRVNGMDESVLMPEQGFSGRLVAHDDAHTHVADWQTEYGPKANLKSVEEICAKYPHNQWCLVNNYRVARHVPRSPPPVEKEEAFDPLDPEDHIKRVTDHVNDLKDWVTGGGGGDSDTTAEPWHEGFKDIFRAPAPEQPEQPEGDGRTSSGSGKDGYSSDVPDIEKIEEAEERRETPIFGSPGTSAPSGAAPSRGSWCWRQVLPWALGLISALRGC